MRLNTEQVQAIKQAAQQVLGEGVRVILFGSRTNDNLRGGDIDLLFETARLVDDRVSTTGRLYSHLIRNLGDRKIDIVLKDASTPEASVMRFARETGVEL